MTASDLWLRISQLLGKATAWLVGDRVGQTDRQGQHSPVLSQTPRSGCRGQVLRGLTVRLWASSSQCPPPPPPRAKHLGQAWQQPSPGVCQPPRQAGTMPAARMAGSSFADVSEEAQSLAWVRPSPHPRGTAEWGGSGSLSYALGGRGQGEGGGCSLTP